MAPLAEASVWEELLVPSERERAEGIRSEILRARFVVSRGLRRVAETAKLLAGQGMIVFVSVITPLRRHRDLAREIIGDDFHEVYVQADFATCAARDPKGLYAKAREGKIEHFTGKDSGFEEPRAAELVLDTTSGSVEQCAADLLGYWRSVADGRRGE